MRQFCTAGCHCDEHIVAGLCRLLLIKGDLDADACVRGVMQDRSIERLERHAVTSTSEKDKKEPVNPRGWHGYQLQLIAMHRRIAPIPVPAAKAPTVRSTQPGF